MGSMGHGNDLHLETSKLRQELCSALKEDESRKKTDEMKKRAIHTAASYDEFRHMVSCSQLTPVTRKEMEMLSNEKRGWQGRSGGVMPPASKSGSNGRRKGSSTKTRNRAAGAIGGSSKNGPLHAPQDHFQFQQDWRRRCLTDSERRAYLSLIGPEKLAVLFRVEMEPDMLEQVLSLVCGGLTPGNQAGELDAVTTSASTDPAGSIDAGGDSTLRQGSREEAARSCVDWLWALTRTGRFEINIQFLDRAEKRAIARVFDLIAETFGDSSCGLDPQRLDSLRKAYAA